MLKINGLHSRYKKHKKKIYRFPFITKDLYIPAINERTAPGLVDLSNDITTMFIVAPANEMKFTKTTSRKIAPFKVVYELMFR